MSRKGWTRRGAVAGLGLSAAACSRGLEAPAYDGAVTFAHGVASGDPAPDRVIIWTRVTPERSGAVPVRWVIARNAALTDVVKSGVVETNEARDYTIKVDVTGLRAGAPYFYGFMAGDQTSPVGKTRTLATQGLDEFKIAVVSCASFPHGFFNAYEALAQRRDVDLVLHLGDYIYEYGLAGYGGETGLALGRIPSPDVECIRLADYRLRHAQAKTQPELQAAHALAPWIVVWDDHEIANDAWVSGAENHNTDAGEGEWEARKRAALQAYYEWMPIRDPSGGAAEAINRSFRFGDLFTLVMLETRLAARTRPFDYATETPLVMQAWDFSNPAAPRPLPDHTPPGSNVRMLPVPFETVRGELRRVSDWRRVSQAVANPANPPAGMRFMPDVEVLRETLRDPARVMLGAEQEHWLERELTASKTSGVAWQIIGNQVLMAPVTAPDLSRTPTQLVEALERLRPGIGALLGFTSYEVPLNPDGWDGYPAARARVLDMVRRAGGNTLVLTGDTHMAWANELIDGDGRVAVELGTTSVTSPSDADYFAAGGGDFGAALRARNPQVKYMNPTARGFLLLTLKPRAATAEFFTVSSIASKEFDVTRDAAFTIAADDAPGVGPITPVAEEG